MKEMKKDLQLSEFVSDEGKLPDICYCYVSKHVLTISQSVRQDLGEWWCFSLGKMASRHNPFFDEVF